MRTDKHLKGSVLTPALLDYLRENPEQSVIVGGCYETSEKLGAIVASYNRSKKRSGMGKIKILQEQVLVVNPRDLKTTKHWIVKVENKPLTNDSDCVTV